ncbi:MAG: hypothetical protein KDB32_03700 [Planctomycetes bacterium]|nr:hypothetical protein [Planctomycetota bacterium]
MNEKLKDFLTFYVPGNAILLLLWGGGGVLWAVAGAYTLPWWIGYAFVFAVVNGLPLLQKHKFGRLEPLIAGGLYTVFLMPIQAWICYSTIRSS